MGVWEREYRNSHPSPAEFRFQQQFSGQLALVPCASGCRAALTDPADCKCACQGINHGCLAYGRPVQPVPIPHGYNPYLMLQQEPERALPGPSIIPELAKPTPQPETRSYIPKVSVKRKVARSLGHALTGRVSQTELNQNVLNGLHNQFSEDRIAAFVDQAFSVFYSRNGPEANRPELYELFENGDLDRALELANVRWVVGRPKLRKN